MHLVRPDVPISTVVTKKIPQLTLFKNSKSILGPSYCTLPHSRRSNRAERYRTFKSEQKIRFTTFFTTYFSNGSKNGQAVGSGSGRIRKSLASRLGIRNSNSVRSLGSGSKRNTVRYGPDLEHWEKKNTSLGGTSDNMPYGIKIIPRTKTLT